MVQVVDITFPLSSIDSGNVLLASITAYSIHWIVPCGAGKLDLWWA